MAKDYYKILGVGKNASEDDIKKAFRKLAHEHHPDKKGGDEAKFKEINEAYSVLSDKQKRQQYDSFGSAGPNMGGTGTGGFREQTYSTGGYGFGGSRGSRRSSLEDLFSSMMNDLGRQMNRGNNVGIDIEISFEESVFGTEKKIPINYKLSAHKEISVDIPAGISDGQTIVLSEMGEPMDGGVPGDLYVNIHVRPHTTLRKEGYNLLMELPIKLSEALLGTEKTILTLDGDVTLKVPPSTDTGTILRVKGKGVPQGNNKRGDLYVRITFKLPEKLSKESKKLIEELKKEGM